MYIWHSVGCIVLKLYMLVVLANPFVQGSVDEPLLLSTRKKTFNSVIALETLKGSIFFSEHETWLFLLKKKK